MASQIQRSLAEEPKWVVEEIFLPLHYLIPKFCEFLYKSLWLYNSIIYLDITFTMRSLSPNYAMPSKSFMSLALTYGVRLNMDSRNKPSEQLCLERNGNDS